jgi:hypothetical protein
VATGPTQTPVASPANCEAAEGQVSATGQVAPTASHPKESAELAGRRSRPLAGGAGAGAAEHAGGGRARWRGGAVAAARRSGVGAARCVLCCCVCARCVSGVTDENLKKFPLRRRPRSKALGEADKWAPLFNRRN